MGPRAGRGRGRRKPQGESANMSELEWSIAREIPRLRRFARALTRDVHAADDLVQDTLERALRKRHLWTRRGALRSWLMRILYTRFVNDRRRGERAPAGVPFHELDADLARSGGQEDRVTLATTIDLINKLPTEQRDVLLLVALEDVSYDEAAYVLKVPVGTVRSRLSRGREALRAMDLRAGERPALRRVK